MLFIANKKLMFIYNQCYADISKCSAWLEGLYFVYLAQLSRLWKKSNNDSMILSRVFYILDIR